MAWTTCVASSLDSEHKRAFFGVERTALTAGSGNASSTGAAAGDTGAASRLESSGAMEHIAMTQLCHGGAADQQRGDRERAQPEAAGAGTHFEPTLQTHPDAAFAKGIHLEWCGAGKQLGQLTIAVIQLRFVD